MSFNTRNVTDSEEKLFGDPEEEKWLSSGSSWSSSTGCSQDEPADEPSGPDTKRGPVRRPRPKGKCRHKESPKPRKAQSAKPRPKESAKPQSPKESAKPQSPKAKESAMKATNKRTKPDTKKQQKKVRAIAVPVAILATSELSSPIRSPSPMDYESESEH